MSIRREKVQLFERVLSDFFHKAGREHLPWRKKRISAYGVWVSEIMLQQTQVSRVIDYYRNFLKRFPDVEILAKASWAEFLPYYQGLGYYARGRNMLQAARMIVREYQGVFPQDKQLLEKIPGIGPYTAAAIMSFAYGADHLAWDTNLKRVIGRFFYGGKHLVTDEAWWEKHLTLPKKELNAALMDFGSALCTARPKCANCPLQRQCRYIRERGVREIKRSKRELVSKSANPLPARAVVFLHEGHRQYYSAEKKKFHPFILPSGCLTRAHIKRFFSERYGLTVAVRPPHYQSVAQGEARLWINAQILLGKPSFVVFPKSAVAEYTTSR